jgi:hypothetical protein
MAQLTPEPPGPKPEATPSIINKYLVKENENVEVNMDISTMMKIVTLTSPYFIVLLFIMISIINSNIKGFIYFFGLIIIYGLVKLFQNSIPKNNTPQLICSLFEKYTKMHPSFISALYMYTITYMLFPMVINNVFNIKLLIILLFCFVVDIIIRQKYGCTDLMSIVLGSSIGFAFAMIWGYTLKESGNNSLLYYDDLISNKQTCSKPSNEKFKCSVFKNGELLQSISPS